MSLQAGDRLGPYEILGTVGAGGMGEVYRARDPRLDRQVAMKVLPHDRAQDTEARARFDREARAIAAVSHPNICVIYDVGHEGQIDYLVMELLEGETLSTVIRRGPMPVELVIDYGIAVADALDTAHSRGLIHRDLKPANILITTRGVSKILDFGLAKIAITSDDETRAGAEPLTRLGETYGTLAYMSPEQLRGEALDRTSDLFSFGLVLYEMATGTRAFDGPTGVVVASMILGQPPASPKSIRPDLPDAFVEIILRCLEKDRQLRTPSGETLRTELMRLKRDLTSGVVPRVQSGATPAVVSEPRRSKTPVLVSAGIVVVAIAALAGYLLQRDRTDSNAVAPPSAGVPLARSAPPPPAPAEPTPTPVAPARPTESSPPVSAPAAVSSSSAASYAFDIVPLPNVRTGLAAISPDGKTVVFRRADGALHGLSRIDTGGSAGEMEILAPTADRRVVGLTVTPDGAGVMMLTRSAAATGPAARPELLRVPISGGQSINVAVFAVSPVGWSPDRKQFAFVGTEPGATTVSVADADGGAARVIARRQAPSAYASLNSASLVNRPSWSPDGKRIALVGMSAGQQVVIVDRASGAETVIASDDVPMVDSVAWLNADHLLVTRATADATNHQVSVLDVKTKHYAPVTHDIAAYSGLSISATGTVAATRVTTRSSLWIGGRSGEAIKQLLPDDDFAPTSLSVTNNGRVAYNLGAGIWVLDSVSPVPRQVVKSGLNPVLTPDGQTIVYTDVARQQLLKVDVNGSRPTVLYDGSAREPSLTPDGKTVFFGSFQRLRWALFSVPTDGGQVRNVVVDEPAFSAQVSSDGRRMLFATNAPGVRVCVLPGCTDRQTFPAGSKWTPDGRLAYADVSNIAVQPITGGRAQPLTTFIGRALSAFAWSPDGTKLVVSRSQVTNEIVLLKPKR